MFLIFCYFPSNYLVRLPFAYSINVRVFDHVPRESKVLVPLSEEVPILLLLLLFFPYLSPYFLLFSSFFLHPLPLLAFSPLLFLSSGLFFSSFWVYLFSPMSFLFLSLNKPIDSNPRQRSLLVFNLEFLYLFYFISSF